MQRPTRCANDTRLAIENLVSALLDCVRLMCPGEEAIWTDWLTEEVMKA